MRAAALFQVASAALVWSSIRDPAWLGVTAGAVAIAIHLASAKTRRRELHAIGTFAAGGLVCESALMHLGVIAFPDPGWVCPTWVVVLWAALGTLAHGPMSPLRDRPWLAGLAALVFAPLSFVGAAATGAITVARPLGPHLAAIGLVVAAAFTGLFALARRANAIAG